MAQASRSFKQQLSVPRRGSGHVVRILKPGPPTKSSKHCAEEKGSIASFGLVGLSKRGIWLIEEAATIKELMAVELGSGGAEEVGPVEWLGKKL
ncbi:hypothetical protein Drorol1_Dr00028327 [Drosera rotundifolia]